MSLTVQSIMQMAVMNGASVLAGRAGLQRNVKAATVLDAPDAINWLRGEELVLTSTYPFRHSSLDELVERLVSRNVSALGLKLNRYLKELPPSMIERADALGLPIISLPVDIAWTDVINPIITAHLDSSAQAGDAGAIRSNFTRVLRSKYGIEEIAALLHEFLGAPVIVEAWELGEAATVPSRPEVPLDWLAEAVRGNGATAQAHGEIPGIFILRHRHRVIHYAPLRQNETIQGYVALIEAGRSPSAFDLDCILQVREAVTLRLLQYRAGLDARQRRRNDLINILVSRHANREVLNDVIRLNSRYDIALAPFYMLAVVAFEDGPGDAGLCPPALARMLESQAILFGEAGEGRTALLFPCASHGDTARSREIAATVEQWAHTLAERGAGRRWSAGVSQVTAVDALADGFEQAALAMRYGVRTLGHGQVSFYHETGLYQIFAHPAVEAETRAFVQLWLQPLIDHDAADQGRLIETLRIFLETNGNYREVSRRLNLHHNTVRYRIGQITRLTGRDLLNAHVRLHLHLALMLLPLIEADDA